MEKEEEEEEKLKIVSTPKSEAAAGRAAGKGRKNAIQHRPATKASRRHELVVVLKMHHG